MIEWISVCIGKNDYVVKYAILCFFTNYRLVLSNVKREEIKPAITTDTKRDS